ncbi:MAG: hypothetical protein JO092_04470 [Candidatus Eremiobacteraeota bacterium]|nr:hypothetical protein [Candidatus Eremiobacteraeota bacterium]
MNRSDKVFPRSLAAIAVVLALVVIVPSLVLSHGPAHIGSMLGILSVALFVAAAVGRALSVAFQRLLLCGSLACAAASIALFWGLSPSSAVTGRTLALVASVLIVVTSTVALASDRPT